MRENDWTKLICEMLRSQDLGTNIYVDTLKKIPYAYEIKSFTNTWDIDEYDQTLFETDMVVYEKNGDKIIPRVIIEPNNLLILLRVHQYHQSYNQFLHQLYFLQTTRNNLSRIQHFYPVSNQLLSLFYILFRQI